MLTRYQSSGLLDVYDRAEVERGLNDITLARPLEDNLQTAAIHLIIAIGAQSRATSAGDNNIAIAGFNYGRRIAFQRYLEDPGIDLIRVFLLLAFYLVGASRRHAAVMHIGVAATASMMLGLHDTKRYTELPESQRSLRWRTYRGLFLMDFINATLLGRNLLTQMVTDGKPVFKDAELGDQTQEPVAAEDAFDVCSFVQPIADSIGSSGSLQASQASHIKKNLSMWAASWKKRHSDSKATALLLSTRFGQAVVAGHLHVSCLYFHALVMVTRHALISTLTPLVQRPPSSNNNGNSETDELGKICIDAAVCAMHTCYDAFEAGALLDNMCHLLR